MEQVLIISYWNPTAYQPNKGVFIHDQVNAICKNRIGVLFLEINILPTRGKIFEMEVTERLLYGNSVITLNVYSHFWKLIYMAPGLVYRWVAKILSTKAGNFLPSIVHSNVVFPCALLGRRFARLYKAKHVITEHWTKVDAILSHPLFGKSSLSTYQECDAIIGVSKYLVAEIQHRTGNKNVYRIPNIIDTQIFKYSGSKHRPENSYRFLCVATWRKPKRLDLILDSLTALSMNSSIQLVIHVIGEGIQNKKYKEQVFPTNLKVIFHGYVTKEKIAALFFETDIFVHASEQETFSIVTAEALATGTPVMVSNIEALPELVDFENGLLIENNVDAWIAGFNKVISLNFDHAHIAASEEDKYTPESIVRMIEEVYAKVSGK